MRTSFLGMLENHDPRSSTETTISFFNWTVQLFIFSHCQLHFEREFQRPMDKTRRTNCVAPRSLDLAHLVSFGGYVENQGIRVSEVGIATSYGLDDRGIGVQVPVGSRIFSSPRRPKRLWGPPNLLSNWYRRLFPRG
jgi:hypothetical protein